MDILPGVIDIQSPFDRTGGNPLETRDEGGVSFLGAVRPRSHHLPLSWIRGYDLEPLGTLESKRKVLRVGEDDGWWLFFEHDGEVIMERMGEGEHGPARADVVLAQEKPFDGA